MTPAEYYDWWFYSGICPGIPTRRANHAVLCEQLSTPGVHLIVLWELLLDNEGFADTSYVGYQNIHGAIERIVTAAREVGAERLAGYLSAVPDSTIVPETHKELKRLIKKFAALHAAALTADIARHGDPRAVPGFDKRKAKRERDRLLGENNGRYQIADRIPHIVEAMQELKSLLVGGLTLTEISRQNDNMAGLACCLRYDIPRWADSPQPPEVAEFLEDCRRLFEEYPDQLPSWGGER